MNTKRSVWIIIFILLIVLFGCWLFLSNRIRTAVGEEGVEIINDLSLPE